MALKGVLASREPCPIEYIAALAERLGITKVFPTPDEAKDALDGLDVPRPARRGRAYERRNLGGPRFP
ncbi:MAG: hypothetical protein ACRD2W_10390 [Acidimicrobiales bacterium]